MRFSNFKFLSKLFIISFCVLFSANIFAEIKNNMNRKDLPESYYKNPLEYMVAEFEKTKDWLLALEISLYYQGWEANKIFYSLDGHYDGYFYRNFDEIPRNSELLETKNIRDAKKSFEWAQKTFEAKKASSLTLSNLFKHYICGIGVEVSYDKAFNLLKSNDESVNKLLDKNSEDVLEFKKKIHFTSLTIFLSYMYFNGYVVEKDIEKAKSLLEIPTHLSWKNFYTGKYAPCDKKFAIFILNESKENRALQSYFLYLMYAGKLNPNDKNTDKENDTKLTSEREYEIYKANLIQPFAKRISDAELKDTEQKKNRIIAIQMIAENIVAGWFFNEYRTVKNPFYNPVLAEVLFTKNSENSFKIWKALYERTYLENGDTSYAKKYYNLAKENAQSPSDLDELKRNKEVLENSRAKNLQIFPWIDNI